MGTPARQGQVFLPWVDPGNGETGRSQMQAAPPTHDASACPGPGGQDAWKVMRAAPSASWVGRAVWVSLACTAALLAGCTGQQQDVPQDSAPEELVSATDLRVDLLPEPGAQLQADLLSTVGVQLSVYRWDGTALPDAWAVRFSTREGAFVLGTALLPAFNAPLGQGAQGPAGAQLICARPQLGTRVATPGVTAEVGATVLDGYGRSVWTGTTRVHCVDAVDLSDIQLPAGDDGVVHLTSERDTSLVFSVTDVQGGARDSFTVRVRCSEPPCALLPATADGTPLPLPTTLAGRFGSVGVRVTPPAIVLNPGRVVRSTWVLETTSRLGRTIQKRLRLLHTGSPLRGALNVFAVTGSPDTVVAERWDEGPYRILLDTRLEGTVQLRMRGLGEALRGRLPRPDAPAVPSCSVRRGPQTCPTLPGGVLLDPDLEASWLVTLPGGAAPGELSLGATLTLPDGRRFTSIPEVVVERGTWDGLHVWPPAATVRAGASLFLTATWHDANGHLVPRTHCPSVDGMPGNMTVGLTPFRSAGNVWSWRSYAEFTGVYTLRTDTLDAADACGTGAPVVATADTLVTVDDTLRLTFGTPPHPVGVVGSPWPEAVELALRVTDLGGTPLQVSDVAFRLEGFTDAWVTPFGSTWLDGEARVLLVADRQVGPVTVVASVFPSTGPVEQRQVVDILGN